MSPHFPLPDVTVQRVENVRRVQYPGYADEYWQMNRNEFAMQVEGVGSFYACNGNEVEYSETPGVDKSVVELYLNGSVYGAVLHQRQILPLHGSTFVEKKKGIMVCGDTGTGKSSLAAVFCLKGSMFLTDDISPVVLQSRRPHVLALSESIKLHDNALQQLKVRKAGLKKIGYEIDKFYLPIESDAPAMYPLDIVMILEIHDKKALEISEVSGSGKVMELRNAIYRPEYLQGMKENEQVYFSQITTMCNMVRMIRVKRPQEVSIDSVREKVAGYLFRQ